MLNIEELPIAGLFEISAKLLGDHRGYFQRLYDKALFDKYGLNTEWKQVSRSFTKRKYTVRGLHVSLPPALEGKTITALQGEVRWISVDLRLESESFGLHQSIRLSGSRGNSLYAARGFAHGCVSLSDDCELLLRADNFFSDEHGTGIRWDDPELAVDWGVAADQMIISDRDRDYPSFADFKARYQGIHLDHGNDP